MFRIRSSGNLERLTLISSSGSTALRDSLDCPAQGSSLVLDVRAIEFPPSHNSYSAACKTRPVKLRSSLTPILLPPLVLWILRTNKHSRMAEGLRLFSVKG